MEKSKKPIWEREADAITRKYMNSLNRWDINGWFVELDRYFSERVSSGSIPEFTVTTPLENGVHLEMDIKKNYSTLKEIDSDMKITSLVTKEQSYAKELSSLQGYSKALKSNKIGIGHAYPLELEKIMKELKAGQMITFENGRSYVCVEKDDTVISLRKCCGSITNETSMNKLLENYPVTKLDYNSPKDMQSLYNKVRNEGTGSISGRINLATNGQEFINKIAMNTSRFKAQKVMLGPVELHAKKSLLSNNITWFDKNGDEISETKVRILYSWLNTSPVVTTFERKEPNAIDLSNDNSVRGKMESLYREHKFEEVYNLAVDYCSKNDKELELNIKSYIPEDNNFKAVTYIFEPDGENGAKLYKGTFKNNDVNGDVDSLKPSSMKSFIDFCEIKYNGDFFLLKEDKKRAVYKTFPKATEKNADLVAKNAAEKAMKKDGKFIETNSSSRAEFLALMDSYKDKAKNSKDESKNSKDKKGKENTSKNKDNIPR